MKTAREYLDEYEATISPLPLNQDERKGIERLINAMLEKSPKYYKKMVKPLLYRSLTYLLEIEAACKKDPKS